MAHDAAPYSWWPAKCRKCGDESQVMRHRVFGGTEAGRCRLKMGSEVCKGRVVFDLNPRTRVKVQKARAIEIAEDYDIHKELDKLSQGIGKPDQWDRD